MREGWTIVKLGDVFTPLKDRVGEQKEEPTVFSVTKYDGVVRAADYFDRRVASKSLSMYKLLEPDWWAYSTIHIDEGSIARNNLGETGAVSPMYTTMKFTAAAHHPRYFEHLLRSREMLARYKDSQQGSINRRRSLPWKVFAAMEVVVPSLAEQQRIVDLIGAVDDAIEKVEAVQRSLSVTQGSISAELHRRARSEEWTETTLIDALGSRDAVRTGPFGSQLHKSDYTEDGPVPVVMPANMSNGRVVLAGIARIGRADADRLARHITRPGDILWSRRGDVGRFAVVDNESSGSLCGTGCFMLRPVNPWESAWLEPWLAAPVIAQWLDTSAVGATMKNLNREILSSVPVSLPPAAERAAIASVWTQLKAVVEGASSHERNLRSFRSNLLTALLSGEHQIPESYDELMEVVP